MGKVSAYWNPMWEWMIKSEQRTASKTGFRDPPAKGAMVSGTRPADMSLISSHVSIPIAI